jgi:hypothetical protein
MARGESQHPSPRVLRAVCTPHWHANADELTYCAFGDAVLGNTYDLPAADLAKIHRSTVDRKLAARVGDPVIPSGAYFSDPHEFDVEAQEPGLNYATGWPRRGCGSRIGIP